MKRTLPRFYVSNRRNQEPRERQQAISKENRELCLSFEVLDRSSVRMLFHVIVITQRNSILKFYNILHDHQTQTNKHIITKRVLDYYPCRRGISKTLLSFAFQITNLLPTRSQHNRLNTTSLLCYSPSQRVNSMWTL